MGKPANSHCPRCDSKADVQVDEHDLDNIVKATSEEVVLELSCKQPNCSSVWRAVYAFAGNQ